MSLFKNFSLNVTFSILMILSTSLLIGFAVLEATRIYQEQQQVRARSLAEAVTAVGAMTSHFKGLWFEDCTEPHLGTKTSTDGTLTYCSMNPALAQRRFNEFYSSSGDTRIEMVSGNNPTNPANLARGFAKWADDQYANGVESELTRVIDNTFYYAKPVYYKESCMLCHGDPADAPSSVISKYGSQSGFGHSVGDRAGLIGVYMPHKSFLEQLSNFISLKSLALVLPAYLLVPLFIQLKVVRPLHHLEQLSSRAADFEKDLEIDASHFKPNTRNEIGRLWHSSRKLLESMRIGASNYANLVKKYRRLQSKQQKEDPNGS